MPDVHAHQVEVQLGFVSRFYLVAPSNYPQLAGQMAMDVFFFHDGDGFEGISRFSCHGVAKAVTAPSLEALQQARNG
jgi:hypothetical protein